MEIKQLSHFQAAADNRSFAQAAKVCNTTRQNVAHSIKMLESELGVPLFERNGNEMMLTSAGQQVVKRANKILAEVDDLYAIFADPSEENPQLNVAVTVNLFASMPEHTDSYFLEHSDDIRLFELTCDACYAAVCDGRADVAIIMSMEREFPRCDAVEIAYSTVYALVSEDSELATHKEITAKDMCTTKLVLMSDPDFQYKPLMDRLDAEGLDRENVNIIPSTSTMLRMVREQGGIALTSAVFSQTPPGGTVTIPLADRAPYWHFYILYKPSAAKFRAVMKLMAGMRDAFHRDSRVGYSAVD